MWQEIVDVLVRRIVTGQYAEGTELPTEAELATEFGVSRPPVREAMKVLQDKGLLRLGQGRRSVVLDRASWNPLDPDVLTMELANPHRHARVFEDLSFVRIALEAQMARQAAERATAEQVDGMRRAVAEMARHVGDPDTYVDHDVHFHALVVAAGDNHIARAIMQTISRPLRESRRLTNQIPGGVARAHQFHTEIFERIAARDPEGAAAAMRAHLEWSWRRFEEMVVAGALSDER
jgi:GntR family transcriptional regulator, galactonate operon transcriptional repressor